MLRRGYFAPDFRKEIVDGKSARVLGLRHDNPLQAELVQLRKNARQVLVFGKPENHGYFSFPEQIPDALPKGLKGGAIVCSVKNHKRIPSNYLKAARPEGRFQTGPDVFFSQFEAEIRLKDAGRLNRASGILNLKMTGHVKEV